MLLLRLLCTLSGCHLKIYMTIAQLKLAVTAHPFFTMARLKSSLPANCQTPPLAGPAVRLLPLGLGCVASFARAKITRAATYMTICCDTEV